LTGRAARVEADASKRWSFPSRVAAAAMAMIWLAACASVPPRPADGFPLDPRDGLVGPFDAAVRRGWKELASGQAARAESEFRRAGAGASATAARIGTIEALVLQARQADAAALCPGALEGPGPTAALLSACGEAFAGVGQPVMASDLYAQAVALSPGSARLRARADALRSTAVASLRASAAEAVVQARWREARAFAAQAVARDPGSALALWSAGDVECAAGEKRQALDYYRAAIETGATSPSQREEAGRLALEVQDYALAVAVFDGLAAQDPRYRAAAVEARLEFRVANWPEAERRAARSARLTRSGAARLVFWTFPEVRQARVTSDVVATDVLGRGDSLVVMRSVALGLLEVDAETHRARPDAALTRGAAARLLLRLARALLEAEAGPACLRAGGEGALAATDAIRVASRCGLLSESGGTVVGGRELTQALDRLRSLVESGEATDGDS
jgi:tetratricopeptide (TPR) repeat protein